MITKVYPIFWFDTDNDMKFFVGVASTQEKAEEMIQHDIEAQGTARSEYVIVERGLNGIYPERVRKTMA